MPLHSKTAEPTSTTEKESFRVEVRRVQTNDTVFMRFLSEKITGCFIHYYSKNAHYCHGKECAAHIHKIPRTWRGYVAAEEWLDHRKKWRPCVFEVTEHCELDMRFTFARGQIWEIVKPAMQDKKHPPVHAILSQQLDAATLRPAFDFVPVLLNMYHVFTIDLSHPNPLPPRVYVEEVDDAPPDVLQGREFQKDSRTLEELMKAHAAAQAKAKAQRDARRPK